MNAATRLKQLGLPPAISKKCTIFTATGILLSLLTTVVPVQSTSNPSRRGETDYWKIYNYLPKETRGYVPAFIAANYVMTYYCDHNICPMETNIPASTDTVQVNKNLHFEQIAELCNVPLDEVKSLNPQYKKQVIPGDSKPYTLRLPIEAISNFIDKQDTIYAHRSNELFRNRKTVAVKENTPSTRKTLHQQLLVREICPIIQ